MTQQDILRMAQEAKFFVKDNEAYSPSSQEDFELTEHLERFAALVAAAEREACAQMLEAASKTGKIISCTSAAEAIRARGQA
jgi:hypothetical protein